MSSAPSIAAVRGGRAPVSELVIDAADGRPLFAAAAARQRPPASLAKLMTLLLAFEAIDAGRLRPGDTLRFTAHAAAMLPSRLGLAAGGRIGVAAALRAIAVISANDVAVSLAERLGGGSETTFVKAMNRRAGELGMTGTHFANATGPAPAAPSRPRATWRCSPADWWRAGGTIACSRRG